MTEQPRAPEGGVVVDGKHYAGGEFIPKVGQTATLPKPASDDAIAVLIALQREQNAYLRQLTKTSRQHKRETKKQRDDFRIDKGWKTWLMLMTLLLLVGTLKGAKTIYNEMVNRLPFVGEKAQTQGVSGGRYASPLPGTTLEELIAYQPDFGQSFGPKTGNKRHYGPHGGVDFDCRVGGCAGAEVAAPLDGVVHEAKVIGTSVNGDSYRLVIAGEDWNGSVHVRLVHVDSLTVKVGDRVQAGQVMGKVSPTDSVSTGPHLDKKVKQAGQWVDPQEWLARAVEENKRLGPNLGGVNSRREAYAVDLIKEEEGFSPTPYPDGPGRYSWGYGTLAPSGGTGTISQEQALADALAFLERNCWGMIDPLPVSDMQAAVLASVCFNNGPGAFKSSTIYAKAKQGDHHGAAAAFVYYDKGGIVRNRRIRESKLYLQGR